jgi:hypothetical protein
MEQSIVCAKCGKAREVVAGASANFCPYCGAATQTTDIAEAPLGFADQPPPAPAPLPITPDLICPECHAPMEPSAVLCIHCGYHLHTRSKLKTTYKSSRREINSATLSFPIRLVILINLLTMVVVVCLIIAAGKSVVLGGFLWVWGTAALVLAFGSQRLFLISRDAEGVPRIHMTRWIGFVPVVKLELDLRKFDAAVIHTRRGLCFEDWMMAAGLVPFCFLPGVLWSVYAMTRETYLLDLSKKGESVRLYDGTSDEKLRELTDALRSVVTLEIQRK